MKPRRVAVYCASSQTCAPEHHAAAERLGRLLAQASVGIVYGGGAVGSMGALADGAMAEGGEVLGVLPRFMDELEWGHRGLTELQIVEDMHQRKRHMLEAADAVVALPGGTGTLEELTEAITWKRLGLGGHPIVLVDVQGFYRPLVEILERMVSDRFLRPEHKAMWTLVDGPDEVLPAIAAAPAWRTEDARGLATL